MLSLVRRLAPLIKPLSVRSFALYKYNWDKEDYKKEPYEKSREDFLTNAEELLQRVPVIEVDGDTARCAGVKNLLLGHPVVYIQLKTRKPGSVVPCPYCGMKYVKKNAGH
eukprot:TRINITY_DN11739_c0_g1_i1.p1 TRINITY_DN11739_c0_g1~~TRINITY_DN11739_c0_g1_i1.p1  ORF type:complete len:110 (+),score=21.12 TRINITY_DN11739_c0_g1_i1:156-485(+)